MTPDVSPCAWWNNSTSAIQRFLHSASPYSLCRDHLADSRHVRPSLCARYTAPAAVAPRWPALGGTRPCLCPPRARSPLAAVLVGTGWDGLLRRSLLRGGLLGRSLLRGGLLGRVGDDRAEVAVADLVGGGGHRSRDHRHDFFEERVPGCHGGGCDALPGRLDSRCDAV